MATSSPDGRALDAIRRDPLTQRVAQSIRSHGLFEAQTSLVLACSGGLDSTCLVWMMASMQTSLSLFLTVAHLNHGLRGEESERDEQSVRALASTLQLPCHVQKLQDLREATGKGRGLQALARARRYHFFEQVRQSVGASKIALAHTRTDQAETVLFRVLRGTGVPGLTGIPVSREGTIVRPLLDIGRDELHPFALRHSIQWVEDSSNLHAEYTRNWLRLQVFPLLRELNPQLDQALAQLAVSAGRDEALLETLTEQALASLGITRGESHIVLARSLFLALAPALQYRVLRQLMASLVKQETDKQLESSHLEAVVRLIGARDANGGLVGGRRLQHLPAGLRVQVTAEQVQLACVQDVHALEGSGDPPRQPLDA